MKAVNKFFVWGPLLLVLLPLFSSGQAKKTPILERIITVSLTNETIDDALKKVGRAGGFSFSYKSSIISNDERVSYQGTNVSVREALDHILDGNYSYREKGNHVILTKAEKQSSRDSRVIDGYVMDDATGRRLKNVSVYDPATMASAVTDSYGYFRLEIKNPTDEEIRLAINKNTYIDTVVVVPNTWRTLLKVPIRENARRIGTIADTVGHKLRKIWIDIKKSSSQSANLENISDTLHRKHQYGVLPFVGTNGKLSGNVVNDYSFNVLGGFSFGNNKFELGGLFNTSRSDVSGVQMAGLANGVGGELDGVQFAGLGNMVMNSMDGAQIAGLTNIALKSAGPLQLAGLGNVAIGKVQGAQVAGLFNLATEEMDGGQVAGLINLAPKRISGSQVSGLINFAREIDGVQFGFINYASRINGVPIGFMSIVAHGYHKIELSSDEIFALNAAFRTGVHGFYNIFTAGVMPQTFDKPSTTWSFGYGIGTAPRLSRKVFLNFDLTSSQIVDGPIEEINLLNKFYLGCDFQLAKMFSITAGVTLNGLLQNSTYENYPNIFADYQPNIINERNYSNDLVLKSWIGGKIGVRFL